MQASKNLVTDYGSSLYSAGLSGQTVFCPAGTYNFTNFSMVAGTKFIGEGIDKTFFNGTLASSSIVVGSLASVQSSMGICDITLINVAGNGSPLIQSYNNHGTEFKDLKFSVPGKIAMDIGGPGSFNTKINGIEFVNATMGIQVGANAGLVQDIFIDKCVIGGCTGPGIRLAYASGVYLDDIDVISAGSYGLLIDPGIDQSVRAVLMNKVLVDTCSDHGFMFAPTNNGVVQWITLNTCWAATMASGKNGMHLVKLSSTGLVGNLSISDSQFINNGGHGLAIIAANDINIDNVTCSANANTSNVGLYDGLIIGADAINVHINGGTFGGTDSFPQNQRFGINNASNSTRMRGAINTTNNHTAVINNTSTSLL